MNHADRTSTDESGNEYYDCKCGRGFGERQWLDKHLASYSALEEANKEAGKELVGELRTQLAELTRTAQQEGRATALGDVRAKLNERARLEQDRIGRAKAGDVATSNYLEGRRDALEDMVDWLDGLAR